MHAGRIANATHVLGKPKGWDDSERGRCGRLAIRQEDTTAGTGMTSAWFPTVHPPVCMAVGPVPE